MVSKGIQKFDVIAFAAALPVIVGAVLQELGLRGGEYCWRYVFPDRPQGIYVRSSVKANGQSAGVGEDSIRVMLLRDALTIDAPSGKLNCYTNRRKGWEGRMGAIIREMADMIAKAGPCPRCSAPLDVNVSRATGTEGRVFVRCNEVDCGHFHWTDEPAPTVAAKPSPVAYKASGAVETPTPAPAVDEALETARRGVAACKCGAGCPPVHRVKKEGPNTGRLFSKCAKCGEFTWLSPVYARPVAAAPVQAGPDAEMVKAQAEAPACKCGNLAACRRVRKPGPTNNHLFYACREYKGGCGFFEWIGPAPGGEDPELEAARMMAGDCEKGCGPLVVWRVGKASKNNGRLFVRCGNPKCDTFDWLS